MVTIPVNGSGDYIVTCNDGNLFIVEQPASVEVEVGKKFTVKVLVDGDGLKYQWYYKDAGMQEFKPSSNKTSAYAYTMQTYMHNRQVWPNAAQYGVDITGGQLLLDQIQNVHLDVLSADRFQLFDILMTLQPGKEQ